ncbi:HU family DNA-binding protein [Haloflavibacter putidus]|uniref:DNA-binding protein n=1 Tax=Haloflavibacter putidus TaxID=2576776 RepID=A0A507ZEP6_9FLAO|nr:HU family DNA-binding protein [Haloflavibacter putidus]TQD36236.1 DNA-binding protein [Haloflavibacter putidus]
MPIQYRHTKRQNNIKQAAETQYIMQAVHTGEINLENLAKEISNECTLSQTDVIAVLHALGEKTKFYLEEGKVVNLDNLGRFKIGFQATAKEKPQQLSVQSIKKFYINYQPSKQLKKWLKAGLQVVQEKKK